MLRSAPNIVRAIAKAEGTLGSGGSEKERVHAEKLSALAQRELGTEFAVLHAQSTVAIWSGFESMVKDITRDWICNQPEVLQKPPWANLKVRVGDYTSLDPEERAAYLVELVDQAVGGPLKLGATRFEKLLETIGLDGAISDTTRHTVFEMQQVRNVIVHRQGIADRRFCLACPWTEFKDGERLIIRRARFITYLNAISGYTAEIINRVGEHLGIAMREGGDVDALTAPMSNGQLDVTPVSATQLNKEL